MISSSAYFFFARRLLTLLIASLMLACVSATSFAQIPVSRDAPISAPTATATASTNSSVSNKRPKIGLVLSGGGARGAAHVGVIKVLEEMRIPIDYIAGTSIGALIGASYASGTPIAELEERLTNADWDDLLTDTSPRADRSFLRKEEDQARLLKLELGISREGLRLPAGAISGQKLDILFAKITRFSGETTDFDRLPIPFRAVATDAESGKRVVFNKGRLPEVMRASMSVPGAVAPFPIGDRLYLDGGLTGNLPIDVVREMGADTVIVVSLGTPLLKRAELQSFLGVSLQTINILTEQNVERSLATVRETDILVSPPLETIGSTDFSAVVDAIAIGAATTRSLTAKLAPFVRSESEFNSVRETQIARTSTSLSTVPGALTKVDEVRVVGLERANADEVKRTMAVKPGEKVDDARLNEGVSRIFGTGYFERVNYSLLSEGERRILTIAAREKPWGPNFLRIGLSMAADSIGEGRFNLLLRHQQTQVNNAGAEWRNDLQIGRDRRFASRFFQPFGVGSIVNIAPGIELTRRPIDVYSDGRRLAQYDVSSTLASLDFGVDLTRNAIARLGIVRGNDSANVSIGSISLPNVKVDQGGVKLRVLYDDLNDPSFPRAGRTASIDYYASVKSLSASRQYRKLDVNYSDHFSFGTHTLALASRYARGYGDALPVFDQFSLGGFLQLSGYRPGELLGESVALSRLSYYRQWSDAPSAFGRNVYLGASGEIGRVAPAGQRLADVPSRYSLGLFAGIDTFLGPLYLGVSRARDRGTLFYFFLGQP